MAEIRHIINKLSINRLITLSITDVYTVTFIPKFFTKMQSFLWKASKQKGDEKDKIWPMLSVSSKEETEDPKLKPSR